MQRFLKGSTSLFIAIPIHFSASAFSFKIFAGKPSTARKHDTTLLQSSSCNGWTSLVPYDESAVKKRLISEGCGEVSQEGSQIEIDYFGSIGETAWTASDVVQCWLKNQQGMGTLAPAFLGNDVDWRKLVDEAFFTDDFAKKTLGVESRLQCKKLVNAARRLDKQTAECPPGTEFDSSRLKGPFKFVLGHGKAIRAIEILVRTMRQGETAEMICRADFAYGSEGLRKANGEVRIPPFATLCFRVTLLSCKL
jgi:hypothetical protein